jgi:hypothetical protein
MRWLHRDGRRRTIRQVLYAMRFVGHATPIGEVGAAWRITTMAPSAALSAIVGPDGLQGTISPLPGGEATFTSEMTATAAETFLEIGAMTFGEGHRLRLTTVGSGYLGPSADPALQQGAVIWRVEEGEGQFAGASGLICANVLLRDNGQIVAHHLGLIFVPESGSPVNAPRRGIPLR